MILNKDKSGDSKSNHKDQSFQSLSSVNGNNEISGSTNIQIEDFFGASNNKGLFAFDRPNFASKEQEAVIKNVGSSRMRSSNSQTYLASRSDSYSYRRDNHKVKQILNKE